MAKQFLDATGLGILWNKIKSTFLPLSGGTMTGNIVCKSPNNTVLLGIGTAGDVQHNNGTGWITCKDANSGAFTHMLGSGIQVFTNNLSDGEPKAIFYQGDNIHIAFYHQGSAGQIYKFNLQKLIDDGYLIRE